VFVSQDVVYGARSFLEWLARESDGEINCGSWPGLALVANPHAVAVLPPAIDEAKSISAAAHGTRTVTPCEETVVDAERRQNFPPPAPSSFLG